MNIGLRHWICVWVSTNCLAAWQLLVMLVCTWKFWLYSLKWKTMGWCVRVCVCMSAQANNWCRASSACVSANTLISNSIALVSQFVGLFVFSPLPSIMKMQLWIHAFEFKVGDERMEEKYNRTKTEARKKSMSRFKKFNEEQQTFDIEMNHCWNSRAYH